MLRFLGALLLTLFLLTACNGQSAEAPPDVNQLISDANVNLHAVSTFRLSLEQSGAPYFLYVDLGDGQVEAEMRRASAQFVSPNVMQGSARVLVFGLPVDVELFSRSANQWVRLSNSPTWSNVFFAPGFDASTLQTEGGGFDQALTGLRNIAYSGTEELEDGSQVYHITGISNGADVAALTVGLIESVNDINVDLYIDRETHNPRRVVLTQPETATEEEPEPTTWIIDLYDFNAPAELDDPEANVGEATPIVENTAEATVEATTETEAEATVEATIGATVEMTVTP